MGYVAGQGLDELNWLWQAENASYLVLRAATRRMLADFPAGVPLLRPFLSMEAHVAHRLDE
jgi:hypothetical protein